jgi:hypothetical protein
MSWKVTEDAKSRWILRGLWILVVTEVDDIDEVFHVMDREPKQMHEHGKVQDVVQPCERNNFSTYYSVTMNNQG